MEKRGSRRSSFLVGVGRLFDFGGTPPRYEPVDPCPESDVEALRSDWEAVGEDLWVAMRLYDAGLGVPDDDGEEE